MCDIPNPIPFGFSRSERMRYHVDHTGTKTLWSQNIPSRTYTALNRTYTVLNRTYRAPGGGWYLVDGEHVEVGDVVLLGEPDPGSALLLIDQLPDVLVHKLPLQDTQNHH